MRVFDLSFLWSFHFAICRCRKRRELRAWCCCRCAVDSRRARLRLRRRPQLCVRDDPILLFLPLFLWKWCMMKQRKTFVLMKRKWGWMIEWMNELAYWLVWMIFVITTMINRKCILALVSLFPWHAFCLLRIGLFFQDSSFHQWIQMVPVWQ